MLVAAFNASVVSRSTSSGDVRSPNPVPRICASSWISGLALFFRASERCLPTAPASLKLSKNPRSASETSNADPVTPFCSVSHSGSVKSALPAMVASVRLIPASVSELEVSLVVEHCRPVRPALAVREPRALIERSRGDIVLARAEVDVRRAALSCVLHRRLEQRSPEAVAAALRDDVELLEVGIERSGVERGTKPKL